MAEAWNLPLYRMDVGALREKYVGESEKRLEAALGQIEREAPAVLLVDEVEKGFNSDSNDSGVQLQLLSQLLWWMEEHRSKVLTIMTTNDETAIPPELVRPGRIDSVMEFPLISNKKEAMEFLRASVQRFDVEVDQGYLEERLAPLDEAVSHASLEKLARDIVKSLY